MIRNTCQALPTVAHFGWTSSDPAGWHSPDQEARLQRGNLASLQASGPDPRIRYRIERSCQGVLAALRAILALLAKLFDRTPDFGVNGTNVIHDKVWRSVS